MAAIVRLKYTQLYRGKWRWIPPRWMRPLGAQSETLCDGPDLTGAAIDRVRHLNEFWESAKAEPQAAPRHGSMGWLVTEYERSSWYHKLKPRTRENTDAALKDISAALGRFQVARLERKHCRMFYEGILEKRGKNAAKATHTWLRRLLSYGVEIGLRDTNPAERMQVEAAPPRKVKWRPSEVAAVIAAARDTGEPQIALLVQLGYDTGQRLSDLLTLTWNDFDGEGISFTQGKTGEELWIPLDQRTKAMLAATDRKAVQVIVSPHTGKPYTSRVGINRAFRKVLDVADVRKELQVRDLRRTAASEISAGGGKIHPITGHRPGSSQERVYVVPDREAARLSQMARIRNKD